jgi:hypothetical protein
MNYDRLPVASLTIGQGFEVFFLCCLGQVGGQQVGEEYLQKLVNEVENLKRELLDNVLSKKRVALTSELQDKHIVEVESQLHKSLENNEILQRKIEGLGT